MFGAALILIFGLYPWTHVPATLRPSSSRVNTTKSHRPWIERLCAGARIHIGLLAPAVATGALLVLMVVLNDYGTVSLLGVKTLSVGVYDARFSMYRSDWRPNSRA